MSLAAELIKHHEGFRGMPYADTEGYQTIGYGTKLPISEEEGELLLEARRRDTVAILSRLFNNYADLDTVRQAVLQDMLYNLGPVRLAAFKQLRAAVADGDYKIAAAEMLDSKWAQQVKGRAQRLALMMKTGLVPDEA